MSGIEALALVATLANLLALVDNAYRGIKFLRQSIQDPRADAFFIRLITEDARYSEWRRRMGIENNEHIESLLLKLPTNARKSVELILKPMGRYLRDAEKLFHKYGIGVPGKKHEELGFKNRLRRLDFMMDGRRELSELLDVLKACNDALVTVAPPAPGYYVSVTGSDPILESSQSPQMLQQMQANQELLAPSTQSHSSRDEGSVAADSSHPRDTIFQPIIELLFTTCLKTLRTIVVQYPNLESNFQKNADRLSLWGTGLFEGSITIDQAFDQLTGDTSGLKANISGVLADLAVTLEHTLSFLDEPLSSPLVLKIKELFSFPDISQLSLKDLASEYDVETTEEGEEEPLDYYGHEMSELTECLFRTLPTVELVFKTALASRNQNLALDERELVLIKPASEISLSGIKSQSAKELLEVDLELIAAMQESLKDTKYAKYLAHKEPRFDAKKMYEDMVEESRQVKYWTCKLAESSEKQKMTPKTEQAMMLHLAMIAQVFQAGFRSPKSEKDQDADTDFKPALQNSHLDSDKIRAAIKNALVDFPDIGALAPAQQNTEGDAIRALEVLKSSSMELRRLAGSKAPEMAYQKDFSLGEKGKVELSRQAETLSTWTLT